MSTPATMGPNQQPDTWTATAPGYAEVMSQWRLYADEALIRLPPSPSCRVLDVACGPGTLAIPAAARAGRVVAVDFSAGMVKELEARARAAGIENLEARVMDAQALELDDASFDLAYCLFAFMFFPDRGRAFRELYRVLAPGGRLLIATWAPIERRPLTKVGFEAMAEAVPQLPLPAKGDLQVPAECEAEMTAAGFTAVSAEPFTASVQVASPEEYLRLISLAAAPFVMLKRRLGAEWPATEARILDALRKRIPAQGCELSAEAIFTVGTR